MNYICCMSIIPADFCIFNRTIIKSYVYILFFRNITHLILSFSLSLAHSLHLNYTLTLCKYGKRNASLRFLCTPTHMQLNFISFRQYHHNYSPFQLSWFICLWMHISFSYALPRICVCISEFLLFYMSLNMSRRLLLNAKWTLRGWTPHF